MNEEKMGATNRLETGQEMMKKLFSDDVKDSVYKTTEEIFPDFWTMTQEHLYGDIWPRSGLSLRERAIATLAALQARKYTDALTTYMHAAQNLGITQDEVSEIIMHVMNYCGWPTGVYATISGADAFPLPEKLDGMDVEASAHLDKGVSMQKKRWGDFRSRKEYQSDVYDKAAKIFRRFRNKMITGHLWGEVESRPYLNPRDRTIMVLIINSLVNIDYKTVLRAKVGLVTTVRAAVNVGITGEEVIEIMIHVAQYAGWPTAINALLVAKEVLSWENMEPDKKDTASPETGDPENLKKGKDLLDSLNKQINNQEWGKKINEVSPDFFIMLQEQLFGDVWTRPELPLRERVLINLVSNIAQGFNYAMESSMRWALENGILKEEILELILAISHFRGWPCGINALEAARNVFTPEKK